MSNSYKPRLMSVVHPTKNKVREKGVKQKQMLVICYYGFLRHQICFPPECTIAYIEAKNGEKGDHTQAQTMFCADVFLPPSFITSPFASPLVA